MTSVKRPAEDDLENAPTEPEAKAHTAAPAPSHLFVVVCDDEYDNGLDSAHEGPRPLGVARTIAGATEIMKTLHDAKRGEDGEEFAGLDTKSKKGKVVGEAQVGNMSARVEKWKVAEGKTVRLQTKLLGLVHTHT